MYRSSLFFLVIFCTLSFNREAFAYLDPGMGSMLLQLLLGGVAGALVIGKLYWERLKELLPGGKRPHADSTLAKEGNRAGDDH